MMWIGVAARRGLRGSATRSFGSAVEELLAGRGLRQAVVQVLDQALEGRRELTWQEAELLFTARGSELQALAAAADEVRRRAVGGEVTYVVNRNINFTNVCVKKCGFCAFSRTGVDVEGYLLPPEEVLRRASEATAHGATEVCIQAGLPPGMDGGLYKLLVEKIKAVHPDIHIHAFSPEEVLYGSKQAGKSIREFLLELQEAGLGSLPGTSAEILDDELRRKVAKGRLSVAQWVEVVTTAHDIGLPTTSTMMFGFCESPGHLARHLVLLRDLQKRAEAGSRAKFTEFVPLGFVASEAPMFKLPSADRPEVRPGPTGAEVLRAHAVARLVLHPALPGGFRNIQASWVKEGFKLAQVLLTAGANDLGGTLMNESISTAAGAAHGQLAKPSQLRRLVWELGPDRSVAERRTTYGVLRHFENPADTSWEAIAAAEKAVQTVETSSASSSATKLEAVEDTGRSFGSYQQLAQSSNFRFRPAPSRSFSTSSLGRRSFSSTTLKEISYSPSYTLVPTYECFNVCSYCNFRKDVTRAGSDWLPQEEARAKLEAVLLGNEAQLGVVEVLVMSGEVHPKAANRSKWLELVKATCEVALSLGLLPHTNVGPLSKDEMETLHHVNVSMGLMLEQTTPSLLGEGGVHQFAPSKRPEIRLQQLRQAAELKIPFTTGILVGIGETDKERLDSLEAIAGIARDGGHVQEVILQPHSLGSQQKLRPGKSEQMLFDGDAGRLLPSLVRAARSMLPASVAIQVPPNLVLLNNGRWWQGAGWDLLLECLAAGATDLGGISPKDEVNPDHCFPHVGELAEALEREGYVLRPRLPVYPQHFGWLPSTVKPAVEGWLRHPAFHPELSKVL